MKQNTKFLWMYVGILFSFALILIIFAGLSRNSETEKEQGLQANIVTLTEEVKTYKADAEVFKQQIAELEESDRVLAENEKTLSQALVAYENEDVETCIKLLATIDINSLTNSQKVIYDWLYENTIN